MQHLARRVLAAAVFTGLAASPSAQAEEPDLYDSTKLRTFNLSFEQADWWDQLVFHKQQEDGIYIEADLEVDGGINPETAGKAVKAGARVLVAGSAVYNSRASVAEAIALLRAGIVGWVGA